MCVYFFFKKVFTLRVPMPLLDLSNLTIPNLSPLDLIATAGRLWVSPPKPKHTNPTETQRKFGEKTLDQAYIHQI